MVRVFPCLEGYEDFRKGFVEAAFISCTFFVLSAIQNSCKVDMYKAEVLLTVFKIYFNCYTLHVVKSLNYFNNHCTYINFTH